MSARVRAPWVGRSRGLLRALGAFAMAVSLGLSPASAADPQDGVYTIRLGAPDLVAQIFPTDVIDPKTGEKDPDWLLSKLPDTIATYLLSSLRRDGVVGADFTSYDVINDDLGYAFRFRPDASKAAEAKYYELYYPEFLGASIVGQGLNGARDCQEIGSGCWNPVGDAQGSYWRFYPPLGLPFVKQRNVILAHYPPYRSMQAGDYLNNPTMDRWNRLLNSVGLPKGGEALYENTVDANPIAAPGAGQGSYYFPTLLASAFFDAPSMQRDYVTSMLWLMTQPLDVRAANETRPPEQRLTLPVLVVGGQSRQFWANKFPEQATIGYGNIPGFTPNQHGLVSLYDRAGAPKTPFMTANHPDVGLLVGDDACPAEIKPGSYYTEGVVAVEKSDLAVACYSINVGAGPETPDQVAAACDAAWLSEDLSAERDAIVCANALVDASYLRGKCGWDEAVTWCAAHGDDVCGAQTDWPACAKKKSDG